jgi:hypothetical protein
MNSKPDHYNFNCHYTLSYFKKYFSAPSKLELPLNLLRVLSTPNPDPDRFKTNTTFKPTFQILIVSKPALPLSLFSSYVFNLQISFEHPIPFHPVSILSSTTLHPSPAKNKT